MFTLLGRERLFTLLHANFTNTDLGCCKAVFFCSRMKISGHLVWKLLCFFRDLTVPTRHWQWRTIDINVFANPITGMVAENMSTVLERCSKPCPVLLKNVRAQLFASIFRFFRKSSRRQSRGKDCWRLWVHFSKPYSRMVWE